ncbi:MAG: pyridoxal phosphate-dependent aminotransferase [Pseudomonadales bacterium]|nr:pyridoxal phosphate-dependent aminotransferase [Pseudomonadales bacterium]
MTRPWAERVDRVSPFRVMEILTKAKQLEQNGRDIIHMEVGEPDFPTPAPIVAAAKQALSEGKTHYTPALGLPELREKIAEHYFLTYSVSVSPKQVVVTAGASGALLLTAALLVNPGESVLMADPGYPCNRHFLQLVGGEAVMVPVDASNDYAVTPSLIEQYWQAKSCGVLLASPANPTGGILSLQHLSELEAVIRKHNGWMIVDEIYHGLTYGERIHTALESCPDAIVINSFSKYFGMTGWRLGWMITPQELVPSLEKLAQNYFISPPTVSQYAALAAFDAPAKQEMESRRLAFKKRRDFLLPALRELGFGIPNCPEGAFYLYADAQGFTSDAYAFCHQLLDSAGVAVTPGIDFGANNTQQTIRFAYTTSVERLQEGVERIAGFLRQ